MNHKRAIITGASRGIGEAISLKLLKEGWHVIGIARNFSHSSLKNFSNFDPIELDLSLLATLPEAFLKMSQSYGPIQTLICNAGRGQFGNLEEFSFEQIRSLIELNFLSHVYLIKTFLPLMKKEQKGDIILIGSEAALSGKRKGSIYCATKFALRGFAQALREECATNHVRVCLINPGMVQTSFFDRLNFEPGAETSEHLYPEDIAHVISMVLSSRAEAVFDEINLSSQKKMIRFKKNMGR